jgi:hypothetical protein
MTTPEEEVIRAAEEYKASLEKLLRLLEGQVQRRGQIVGRRKNLCAQSLITKIELAESEQMLASAGAQLYVYFGRRLGHNPGYQTQ